MRDEELFDTFGYELEEADEDCELTFGYVPDEVANVPVVDTLDIDSEDSRSIFFQMIQLISSTENISNKVFWETPAFDESEFKIIDNQIQIKEEAEINEDAEKFFISYLKPLVDRYLEHHTNNDVEVKIDNGSYERAMMLLR